MNLPSHDHCVFPSCTLHRRARGLCAKHFAQAKRVVDGKIATWEQLVERRKALPRGCRINRGRPPNPWFSSAKKAPAMT